MMKSAIFTEKGVIGCFEVDMPSKNASEVLVHTLRSSICGSDLHVGYYGWGVDTFPLPPGSPGHESVCEVVDGRGTNYSEGQLVLAVPIISEAKSFSEYQVIPEKQLLMIDKDSESLSNDYVIMRIDHFLIAAKKMTKTDMLQWCGYD